MDIEQLKYFITLCKFRHLTQASNRLFISQSSLSKHIAKLEQEVGVHLFDRIGHSLHITTAGQDFLKFAQNVVAQHEKVLLQIQNYLNESSEVLTLGAIPILAQYGFHKKILDFKKKYPSCDVRIFEDNSEEILKLLDDEVVELAILRTTFLPEETYRQIKLAEDELVVVTSQEKFADEKILNLKSLSQENFILLDDNNEKNFYVEACNRAGFNPKEISRFSRIETILGFVEEGEGVTLLMEKFLKSFDTRRVSIKKFEEPVTSEFSLVFPHGRRLSPSAILFHNELKNFFAH